MYVNGNRFDNRAKWSFLKSKKRVSYFSFLIFLALISFTQFVASAPTRTTYQAKIIKPDGYPLEAAAVNFRFTIMDPAGTCTLYVEDFSSVNMTNSGGLIALPLGSGTRTYPTSGTVGFSDVFDNSTSSMTCQSGSTFSPVATDIRKIVMQFLQWPLILFLTQTTQTNL
jgi:trimeric autotransporter adhesin